jgi:hypothetical protein
MLRRASPADVLFAAAVVALTAMAARVWWLSDIVPGQDYPQFLVFVRAARDIGDPGSPFHGSYTAAPWFTPTGLPVHFTGFLSLLCGHSIESAGKLLLTLQNIGLVAASLLLLKTLGRPSWAVVLLFPLIHSVWTVVGGFAAYSTALPLVVLGWALTVRWLRRQDVRSGVALATCLCVTLLWHGIAYSQLGLGFAVLWSSWRAPSIRVRVAGAAPALPSLVQYAVWMRSTFVEKVTHDDTSWLPPWSAADSLIDSFWASVPHSTARALFLAMLVGGLSICATNLGATGPGARLWRFRNPFLVVSAVYLAGYFVLPITMNGVAGFSNRFSYVAALAFVFAWNLPSDRVPRGVVLAAVISFSVWCLNDVAQRFHEFHAATRGASELMNRLGPRESLYYYPGGDRGFSPAFGPGNKAMIELEQFATARRGGLPNSSFAGYGYTYVRYVNGQNPMPGFYGPPAWSQEMTRFEYVLVQSQNALSDPRFRLVESRAGWTLYGVCGSRRFPTCA